VRNSRQQLVNELDRVRHENEDLQEENVRLQSECDRLSSEALGPQTRSAGSGDAEADANRDWRVRLHQQQTSASSTVDVVTEGFVLPHDVEQLQERIAAGIMMLTS